MQKIIVLVFSPTSEKANTTRLNQGKKGGESMIIRRKRIDKEDSKTKWDILDAKVRGQELEILNYIYNDLPILITKVAYGAFAKVESYPGGIICPKDIKFITPYFDELKKVFDEVIQSRILELERMTNLHMKEKEKTKSIKKYEPK